MLPWLTIYNHTNYTGWGLVYLAEMKDLERYFPEVQEEFRNDNFVVKRRAHRFGGQAMEWVNCMCKVSSGITEITQTNTARDSFCMTWSKQSNTTY